MIRYQRLERTYSVRYIQGGKKAKENMGINRKQKNREKKKRKRKSSSMFDSGSDGRWEGGR